MKWVRSGFYIWMAFKALGFCEGVKCSIDVWQTREQNICARTCRKVYQVRRPNWMDLWFAAAANQAGKSQVFSLGIVQLFYRDFRNA